MPSFDPFRKQVEWELRKQARADLVVLYLHPATQAPITLLEFGLCVRTRKRVIVCCPKGYHKRANVQLVCMRFGVQMVQGVVELRDAIMPLWKEHFRPPPHRKPTRVQQRWAHGALRARVKGKFAVTST